MKKKGSGKVMGYNGRIKFRKEWFMSPVEKVQGTKKGARGYNRNEWKKQDREQDNPQDFDSNDGN
jgi:hypothetical protein